jgi:addiction module HigA family antidote
MGGSERGKKNELIEQNDDTEHSGARHMTTELLDDIHPGEILLEDFMKPLGISARQLAADMDVPPSRISDIVNGTRPIIADTALRLGLFFSMDPRYWLNLQTEYDMRTMANMLP